MIVGESKPPLLELAHHGTKGMHWGHRKNADPSNGGYSRADRESDRSAFGNVGERRINRRMNAGQTHKQARAREIRRAVGVQVGSAAALTAVAFVGLHANVLARDIVMRAETNRSRAAVANVLGIAAKASPTPFVKPNRSGAFNITTL